jgi:DMSO/TMAO reductase YedYZ heme-binding membrane subunit
MPKYWPVILAAFVAGVAILTGLKSAPAGIEGWNFAARYTARVGFPFLMAAFTASSLVKLWPNPVTKSLMRRRKWWGLGFATSHSFHLFALLKVFSLTPNPPAVTALLPGAFVYLVLYAMVLTSWRWAYRALGKWWGRLHKFGIYLLWFAFTLAYALKVVGMPGEERVVSLFLLAFALCGWGLRIAASKAE